MLKCAQNTLAEKSALFLHREIPHLIADKPSRFEHHTKSAAYQLYHQLCHHVYPPSSDLWLNHYYYGGNLYHCLVHKETEVRSDIIACYMITKQSLSVPEFVLSSTAADATTSPLAAEQQLHCILADNNITAYWLHKQGKTCNLCFRFVKNCEICEGE